MQTDRPFYDVVPSLLHFVDPRLIREATSATRLPKSRASAISFASMPGESGLELSGKRLEILKSRVSRSTLADANENRDWRICRWQVELFFKWIKQHLRIKVFFGTSENAVKT